MDVGADVGVGVDADVMNNDVYSKRVDVDVTVDMNVAGMWVVCMCMCCERACACACAYECLRAGLSDFGNLENCANLPPIASASTFQIRVNTATRTTVHGQTLLASRQKIFNT